MAVGSGQVSVGTTATLLASVPAQLPAESAEALELLADASTDVYLGGAGVTTSTGFKFAHGTTAPLPVTLFPGDSLYGIVATGTATIEVLAT